MRILVTGGAGFVGSHVVDALIEAGHEVAVLDNLSTGRREHVHAQARLFEVDLRDAASVDAVFAEFRPQVVDHHAAQASVVVSTREPVEDARVNIIGSLHLLEASRRHGVRKWIYASTGGAAYGDPPVEALPVQETYAPLPLSPYGVSKYTVEHYVRLYGCNHGLRFTVLRYGNIYGPRQDPTGEAGVVAIFVHRISCGQSCVVFGDGRQTRDFVYVGDVAQANLRALEAGDGEVYNIGTGRETSVLAIVEGLRAAWAEKEVRVEFAAERPGEVFRIALDVRKAEQEMQWRASQTIEQGLAAYVDWYRRRQEDG